MTLPSNGLKSWLNHLAYYVFKYNVRKSYFVLRDNLIDFTAYPGVPSNLALYKHCAQSSTYDGSTGCWRLVDGNIEKTTIDYMGVTKLPADDPNPWFRIDLADLYLVQTVKIIRRFDCCFDEMKNVEARVGMRAINSLFMILVTGIDHAGAELWV